VRRTERPVGPLTGKNARVTTNLTFVMFVCALYLCLFVFVFVCGLLRASYESQPHRHGRFLVEKHDVAEEVPVISFVPISFVFPSLLCHLFCVISCVPISSLGGDGDGQFVSAPRSAALQCV